MPTKHDAVQGSPASADNNGNVDTTVAESAPRSTLSRKRTKTGCLTCRKRRIKCGEERPMCKNCIKSRRHCDGYVQRVVFKPPTFEYRTPLGGTPLSYQNLDPNVTYHPGSTVAFTPNQPAYSPMQPAFSGVQSFERPDLHWPTAQQLGVPIHTAHPHHHPPPLHLHTHPVQQHFSAPAHQAPPHITPGTYSFNSPTIHAPNEYIDIPAHPAYTPWSNISHHISPSSATFQPLIPVDSAVATEQAAWHQPTYGHMSTTGSATLMRSSPSLHSESRSLDFARNDSFQTSFLPDTGPTQLLRDAAVETQDDDYFDVNSDDGVDDAAARTEPPFGVMSLVHQLDTIQQMQIRAYDTFLSHGMLDTYRPERVANPLRNEATARVFLHFMTATGPSLSPFERHTANPSSFYTSSDTPLTQRGIWTYTMPMAALHNQGLLHAMLALASLHIARLQNGSVTPSLQHYAWSLKRVHSAVVNPKKRLNPTTIAASMLLGFYEVLTAEHSKWSTHLAGAKQLIMETDFPGMMRQFGMMKKERGMRIQHEAAFMGMPPSPRNIEDDCLDQIHDVDEGLISRFFGQKVSYTRQGHIEVHTTGGIPRLDLSKLELLKDLFWWYCKQDAYQSIISGNPLLMDYSRWSACPPRAPLGRPDAVYGSFDHLTLLLGRVADFAAKDRVRKLKVMDQNGDNGVHTLIVEWPEHHRHDLQLVSLRSPPPGPMFYGMAPTSEAKVRMPTSYERSHAKASPDLEQETWSLETALQEHDDILAALHEFKASLGVAFATLSADCHSPVHTSFGPASVYRSFDIGCMMAIWNMTVIIAIRSHPYYHPAAHVAAAMATMETMPYAIEIGRIAAGIVPGPQHVSLNPFLGAALVESCMPSFFAAVQYQQPEQRHETIVRIFSIAQRTGWATAGLIAHGCETAWVKAAQAGRGPPYTRIGRLHEANSTDSRLTGSWEHQDPRVKPDEDDQVDRRFVRQNPVARLHWAIGIIGNEHDI
ncbi:hypothetical protein AMS68_006843 [Peltaster fructicola]|uniref:Zn(2)-C6 fungal-type domain-containing protein n=1 Tax=Peltaster fructicola TaxID=286661 RepID=A0A6H0Y2Z5_9PEZI|nr:hypothetical protein AMS68_006843 [Peltaster fructicola]